MHDDATTSKLEGMRRFFRIYRIDFLLLACLQVLVFRPVDVRAQAAITPNQQRAFEREGKREFDRGAFRRSRVYYERLVRAFPGDDRYWIGYGSSLIRVGQTKRAIAAFRRAVQCKGSLRLVAALYLAEAYRQDDNMKMARGIVYWLLRQEDLPENLLQEVLLVYDLIEDSSQPASEYEELVQQGVSHYRRNQFEAAKSDFDGAITLRRTDEARLMYGFTLLKLNRFDEAKSFLLELRKDTQDRFIQETIDSFLAELKLDRTGAFWTWAASDFTYEHIAYPEFSADSFAFTPELELGYRLWQREDWRLAANYRLQWNQLITPNSDTLIRHRLGGKLSYYGERWQAQFELRFGLSQFDDEAFLFRIVSGFSLARRFQESIWSLSLYGVSSNGLSESYSYLTGPMSVAKMDWTFLFDGGTLDLWVSYAIDDIDDSVINGALLPIANKYGRFGAITEFGIGNGFVVRTSQALGRKRYREHINPGGQKRIDITYHSLYGIGFRGRSNVFADLDFHYNVNNSNITDANLSDQRFREKLFTLKVYWDINP